MKGYMLIELFLKKKPLWFQGLLAGSSWLLHIKQMYIKNQDRISWNYNITGSCVLLCLPSITERRGNIKPNTSSLFNKRHSLLPSIDQVCQFSSKAVLLIEYLSICQLPRISHCGLGAFTWCSPRPGIVNLVIKPSWV